MVCVIVSVLLVGVAAYFIAGGVYRRLIKAGYSYPASIGIGVFSFIASLFVICLLVAIFLTQFRLLR
jgi:hypothetical protein